MALKKTEDAGGAGASSSGSGANLNAGFLFGGAAQKRPAFPSF